MDSLAALAELPVCLMGPCPLQAYSPFILFPHHVGCVLDTLESYAVTPARRARMFLSPFWVAGLARASPDYSRAGDLATECIIVTRRVSEGTGWSSLVRFGLRSARE